MQLLSRYFLSIPRVCALVWVVWAQALSAQSAEDWHQPQHWRWQWACDWLQTQAAIQQEALEAFTPTQQRFIVAIAFPEMLRYHSLQNLAETTTLQWLYVQYGTAYADFSIGVFQMKPSFAEALEKLQPKLLAYPKVSLEEQRRLRIERLNDQLWQFRYLAAFYLALEARYAHKTFDSELAKLRFYAASYNLGLAAPISKVDAWVNQRAFPHGLRYAYRGNTNYTLVAAAFFEQGCSPKR